MADTLVERALREVDMLLTEIVDGPSRGAIYGIGGVLRNKLHTIRLAARAGIKAAAEIEALRLENARLREDREVAAERVMKALWPLLGGNHTEAEIWEEIGNAVEAALSRTLTTEEGSDGRA